MAEEGSDEADIDMDERDEVGEMEEMEASDEEMQLDAVQVCVRIRPLSATETAENAMSCVRVPKTDKQCQLIIGKDRAFTFDRVFDTNTEQEEIYKDRIQSMVHSFVKGYNATVLAYGQTGSGKTFSMGGLVDVTQGIQAQHGVIPRVIEEIYQQIDSEKGDDVVLQIEYLEVYNEEIRDLLHPETPSKQLSVRENGKGDVSVAGVQSELVRNKNEVYGLFVRGSSCRSTGSTLMNEQSSRSHAIFSIILQRRSSRGNYTKSKFHLVDLAGSERAKRTGAVGGRFKESVNINQGLLALGNVISALGDDKRRNGHIPYRQSKLTRMLQDSLGGNSNTLIIACITPCSRSLDESLNTLKYANRAKKIKNRPILNEVSETSENASTEMVRMQEEISLLQQQLREANPAMLEDEGRKDPTSDVAQLALLSDQLKLQTDEISMLHGHMKDIKSCCTEASQTILSVESDASLARPIRRRLYEAAKVLESLMQLCHASTSNDSDRLQPVMMRPTNGSVSEELLRRKEDEIVHLRKQLDEARDDLLRDEEIFETRNKEITRLQSIVVDAKLRNEALMARVQEMESQGTASMERPLLSKSAVSTSTTAWEKGGESSSSSLGTSQLQKHAELEPMREGSSPKRRHSVGTGGAFTQGWAEAEEADDTVMMHSIEIIPGHRKKLVEMSDRLEKNKEASMSMSFDFVKDDAEHCNKEKKESQLQNKLQKELEGVKVEYEHKMGQMQKATQNLEMNIKMKEELIRTMVQSENKTNTVLQAHQERIAELESNVVKAKQQLVEAEIVLNDHQKVKDERNAVVEHWRKDRREYELKLKRAENELQQYKHKEMDTEKLAALSELNEKRIQGMKDELSRLKNEKEEQMKEQTQRAKKFHDEIVDKQREINAHKKQTDDYLRKIQQLEQCTERQRKQLEAQTKRLHEAPVKKTNKGLGTPPHQVVPVERAKSAGSRRPSILSVPAPPPRPQVETEAESLVLEPQTSSSSSSSSPPFSLDPKTQPTLLRRFEAAMASLVQAQEARRKVQQTMQERKDVEQQKEKMHKLRNGLTMKQLRGDLALRDSISMLENSIEDLDKQLRVKPGSRGSAVSMSAAMKAQLLKERGEAAQKLEKLRQKSAATAATAKATAAAADDDDGDGEDSQGEKIQLELEELEDRIEAFDLQLEYVEDELRQAQHALKDTGMENQEENFDTTTVAKTILSRMGPLNDVESRTLLMKCFQEIVSTKQLYADLGIANKKLEAAVQEKDNICTELKTGLHAARLEFERRLTLQQKENEVKLQSLLAKLQTKFTDANLVRPSTSAGEGAQTVPFSISNDQNRPTTSYGSDMSSKDLLGTVEQFRQKDKYLTVLERHVIYYKNKSSELSNQLHDMVEKAQLASSKPLTGKNAPVDVATERIKQLEDTNDSLLKELSNIKTFLRGLPSSSSHPKHVHVLKSALREIRPQSATQ